MHHVASVCRVDLHRQIGGRLCWNKHHRVLCPHHGVKMWGFIISKAPVRGTKVRSGPGGSPASKQARNLGRGGNGYLSTILYDYSRYVIGWKLCGTMRAEDVTETLDIALAASGCDSARVLHKPRLLSDNGASYIAEDLAKYL